MTDGGTEILALDAASRADEAAHLLGSLASADLNVNLMSFRGDAGIDEHTNNEVDVLIVAMAGDGIVTIDGAERRLSSGQAMIIAKGTARAIRSAGTQFAYLTCHGRRPGLMPTLKARPRP